MYSSSSKRSSLRHDVLAHDHDVLVHDHDVLEHDHDVLVHDHDVLEHDGYPAHSHHDKIPSWWVNVSNDKGGKMSVTKSHHT